MPYLYVMKYWVKTPSWLKMFYPKRVWHASPKNNAVYLTFDDGPTPEITDWVLEQLHQFDAKATFFLVGNNAQNYPSLVKLITDRGHSIGNHTYAHLKGWQTDLKAYLQDVKQCSTVVNSHLFRPPYGRIKSNQARALIKKGYSIIMWDILSADFDLSVSGKQCAENVIRNLKPGSIIVFHDSKKAWDRLRVSLPLVLEEIEKRGFKSLSLN